MKRGLKWSHASSGHVYQAVKEDSPMKRGLKYHPLPRLKSFYLILN